MADRNTRIRANQIFDGGITADDLNDSIKTSDIIVVADGGGSVINTGAVADLKLDFNAEIVAVTLLADQTGSITWDILKDTFANYPPATSIVASANPTITSSNKREDSTLTGWTKTLNDGETLRFTIDSVSTITRCSLILKIKRT